MIGRVDNRGGVATAALLVTVVTAASRLTGFAREIGTAAVFGAGPKLDAFLVANGPANIVIALLASATTTAAIPVISARVGRGDPDGAHRLFRTICIAVVAALGVASIGLAVATPALVRLLAPGFSPEQFALAARLTRILLLATVLVAGMNLIAGLLQVHRRFFWPAFVGIPFNAAMLVAALAFGHRVGVEALAWGFVVGSLLRVLVQLPSLRATGYRWTGSLRWRDPGVTAVLGLVPVVLLGHVTSNVNSVVDRVVASGLEDGSISALNYAFRLLMLPHGLLVVALLQVVYPVLGATERSAYSDLATRAMRTLTILLVPVAAALFLLAGPLVEVAYGRGEFDAADQVRTASGLAAYAPGLVALGMRDVAMRALYGLQDRWRPGVVVVVGMVVNVVGDVMLGPRFEVPGLAAATSLSFLASAAVAVGLLARPHRAVAVRGLAAALTRSLLAVLPAMVAISVVLRALPASALAVAAASALSGVVVYLLALRVLRAPELDDLQALVRRLQNLRPRRT